MELDKENGQKNKIKGVEEMEKDKKVPTTCGVQASSRWEKTRKQELVFPLMRADEIDVKVKQVSEKGAVLLLYKNARVDMNMLDKVVGVYNWSCSYREIKGVLYCEISIYDEEKGIWISKEDAGIESRADEEGNEKKGEASDSFKRASFRFGIGRELYSSPFIFANVETTRDNNNRWKLAKFLTFSVSHIDYDSERNIKGLTIVDNYGNVVFSNKEKVSKRVETPKVETPKVETPKVEEAPIVLTAEEHVKERLRKSEVITNFYYTLDDEKKAKINEWFMKRYKLPVGVVMGVNALKMEQLDDAIKIIEKMK